MLASQEFCMERMLCITDAMLDELFACSRLAGGGPYNYMRK